MLLIYTSIPFDTLRIPDTFTPHPVRTGRGGAPMEFRELLNEPSSRKPLITKGLGEERAGGKREADIRGEGPKPQISREKFSGMARLPYTSVIFLKVGCVVRLVRTPCSIGKS